MKIGDRVVSSKTVYPRRGTLSHRIRRGDEEGMWGGLWQIVWDADHLPNSMEWERDLTLLDAVTRLGELTNGEG